MRIGFDARMIDHPGIGRYISNLLNAMLKLNTGHEFVLFGNPSKLQVAGFRFQVEIVQWSAPVYSLKEQMLQPFSKHNLDILHCPHFNIPYFYKGKLVVTIHDLIYLIFPESVPSKLATVYANFMISRSVTKAAKIIAVSENTKKDILRFFKKANSNNIKVVYEAAAPCFKKITDKIKLMDVKKKYDLPDKFILFVGSLKYHKNLSSAVKAYLHLKKRIPDYSFVVVGRSHKREAYIEKMIKSSEAFYLGEISSEDLTCIYNLASVLLHPSLYEGFGLTILEAMACGTPVICSKSASLPEVGSDAVLGVDANDTRKISDVLYNTLTDERLREDLISRGFDRVKEFSWEKTAEKTLKLYEDVA